MKFSTSLVVVGLFTLFFSPSVLRGQEVVRINEFMVQNQNTLDDEDGDAEDWIEIFNSGTTAVNLLGWHLTDATNNLTKWTFPSVSLPPNGYLIVFASNKDRDVGQLHTNFRLGDNEYLALVRSNGVTIVSEFFPSYPVQAPDISYGVRGNTSEEVLLAPGARARALIPVNAALEPAPGPEPLRPWTLEGLNETGWLTGTTGVGYDYAGLTGLDVGMMSNINTTVYIRVPFVVSDPSVITALKLRMRYDDGMIAYLNGREVAWDNAPDPAVATWNSAAPANRDDATAVVPRDFTITAFKDFLHVGTNLLAIQGLNNGVASSDLLMLPELIATVSGAGTATLRYFPAPTPGGPNNAGVNELGPIITEEDHHPAIPTDNDAIRVSARIQPARGSVTSATLHYRVNFGTEATLPFLDDGNSGDAGIGDGIYGALIPASAHAPGQMVRWYITALDSLGGTSRLPSFVEPLNAPEYLGTVVANPALTNPLPVLHWFIQNPAAAENDAGTRASIFYDGEFYDNVGMNLHGQSSRGFPKKSYDIDLHPGHNFKWKEGEPRADDINLLTTYPDKAQMRNVLSYETYRDAGTAYHWVIPVRVQQNGSFWGTAHIVENGDEDWLVRLGINSQGALYKMYNTFSTTADATSGAEKKTRKGESNADLTALAVGIALTGEPRRRFLYDNLDVAEVVDFLATRAMTGDTDCCHKNYYFYRDSGQSDEWQMWPWDVDLSFGRRWIGSLTYWDQNMIPDTPLFIGDNNRLAQAVFGTPEMRQMYLRRVRTLMDELLKAPGTPIDQLHYEPRIDELAAQIAPDAALDAAKWNSHAWGNGSTAPCCPQSLPAAVAELKNVYLPQRRTQLFNHLAGGTSELPNLQPPGTVLAFGTVEANPVSGNQEEEYVQLQNPNAFAVDISDWTLTGGIHFKFRGGTVVPANGTLYVAANRPAWRNRASAPNRNNALFVVGDYEGRLSARGENLELIDRQGVTVAMRSTPPLPSPTQESLRITEVMYHPPALPGDTFAPEAYEYIELKNIGIAQINLTGVRLTDGILFNFTSSAITSLAAGAKVLAVKNVAAFTQRYGATAAGRIAGIYTNDLDNAGERIRLLDPNGEKILDFEYQPSWYPITDGRGFSLVIVNPLAPYTSWDLRESWRPSGHEYGTPGTDDSPLAAAPGIVINEILTHTDLPQKDAIELYNPTAASVDVSGWYLTDDPSFAKKFRLPNGSTIAPRGYLVFDEDDFNPTPGVGTSFSISSTGDETYLFSGNSAGELTGYYQGYSFEAAANGVSFGRYLDSLGRDQLVAMAALTLGSTNSAPKVGPVVISEINYHPPPKLEGIDFVENFADEFIELQNITGTPVQLFDAAHPTNTWRIRGGVEFDLPPNVTLPANGRLLVVSFDPSNDPAAASSFRTRLGLSAGVTLVGPFTGSLGNEGDDIRLRRPDAPEPVSEPDAGLVPSIVEDRVNYTDNAPWPLAADGFGSSLQRVTPGGFGNDPANWRAANITPANAYPGGNPPVIVTQPPNQTVVASSSTSLSVTATGDGPLRYQWIFAGNALPGATNSTLSIPNVTPAREGVYQVLVLNPAGSTASSNALLTVVIPAAITQQPADTVAHLGATAIFVVQASSSTPLSFRWRKNSNPLPDKTNSFLSLPNLTAADAGVYDVVITDAVGSITSAPARLTVLENPLILTQPASLAVTVLSTPVNVSFSVVASSGTPLRYRWLFNGTPLATSSNIVSVTNATLNITNVDLSFAGNYSVVVTDNFGSATSQVATLTVNTRAELTAIPGTQAVPEGGIASFSAAWTGSGPFLHRWRRITPTAATLGVLAPGAGLAHLSIPNGYIVASATNSVLVLTNVGPGLAGTFDIVVSNAVGQLASEDGTLSILADADHDGLPDTWENGRPGFSSANASDALRDDDGDRINNRDEYFAGTDYLDNKSYLRVDVQMSGAVRLTFSAVAGRSYVIQSTTGLNPATWTSVAIEPARLPTRTVTVTDAATPTGRFYRLVTPAQP